MVTLDVSYIFRKAGGAEGLWRLLHKYDQADGLKMPTLLMWRSRGVFPRDWQVAILYVLIREGHDITKFFVDDTEFAAA